MRLDTLALDVRFAVRSCRAAPGFTLVAILSLALGIGANTAIFSVIDEVMLRPLPVAGADRLVQLTRATAAGKGSASFTAALWNEIARQESLFEDLFAYASTTVDLSGGGEARRVAAGFVSGSFFAALGVHPQAGRLIERRDDRPGCPAVAVISDAFWRSGYGASAAAVGSTIPLDGHPFEIVGVAEPAFFGVEVGYRPAVWVPLCGETIVRGGAGGGYGGGMGRLIMAKLAPGDSIARAKTRLSSVTAAVVAAAGAAPPTRFDLEPFARGIPDLREGARDSLLSLMAVVAVVLLIACANVANLLLARATARQREIAVRLALGATRTRIIRQLLTESLLISLAGAVGGLLVARWAAAALVRLLSPPALTIALDLPLDATVLGFTLLAATGTGILFGLAPAWRAGRVDAHAALRAAGRGAIAGHARFHLGKALVAGQVALSMAAIAAALLLVGSWRRLATVDAGFRPDHVVVASADIRMAQISDRRQAQTYASVLERLRAIPGVTAASGSMRTPIGNGSWTTAIEATDCTDFTDQKGIRAFREICGFGRPAIVELNEVTDGYFAAVGIPLRAGRDFSAGDGPLTTRVAIVSETLARQAFGGAAIGRRFRWQFGSEFSAPVEIVGIAGDTKMRSLRDDRATPMVYLATRQNERPGPSLAFAIRTTLPPATIVPAVKSAFAESDPRISLRLSTLETQVDGSLHLERALGLLSACFGALALGLASMGLYGIVSYAVARRRNEIGVRMALGADRRRIVRMVFADVGQMVGCGLAIGVPLSLWLTRLVATLLYGLTPGDPATLAGAAGLLAAAATTAAFFPARRAALIDPLAALRDE